MALVLAGVDFISLMIWGSVITLFIDRYGRKPLMLFGSIGCGICFTIVTVGLAIGTKATLAMSVAFIFGYHLFYVSTPAPPIGDNLTKPRRDYLSFASHSCTLQRSTPLECEASVIQWRW